MHKRFIFNIKCIVSVYLFCIPCDKLRNYCHYTTLDAQEQITEALPGTCLSNSQTDTRGTDTQIQHLLFRLLFRLLAGTPGLRLTFWGSLIPSGFGLSLALSRISAHRWGKEEFQGKCQKHRQRNSKTEGKKRENEKGFEGQKRIGWMKQSAWSSRVCSGRKALRWRTSRSLSRALPIIPITSIISPRQLTIILIRPLSWENHNFVPARAF